MNNTSKEVDDLDDNSTSRSSSPDFVPYKTRPEWDDIEPISIKTKSSVMNIKYPARFEETFSYFRAILCRDELSERSLALTADCIEMQSSNYTVWFFRRRILRELKHHISSELAFVENIIMEQPKNYQVWYHRRALVDEFHDGSEERRLTAKVFGIDSKNYHAWQHRQWAVKRFKLWDEELLFSDSMISSEINNNSAWHYRYFVVSETKLFEETEWLDGEINFVQETIKERPNDNESPWSYLRGLLILAYSRVSLHEGTRKFCDKLLNDQNCRSPHLLAFTLDIIRDRLLWTSGSEEREILKAKALDLCDILIETDQIRSKYWSYIKSKVEQDFS